MAKAPPAADPAPAEYTVVARRYRPRQFAELIGQEHVARALVNALQSGRVAHAYLFTGARGVGKTSAARILAKALNCAAGPTATPCDACDSCTAVAAGQDVDVLEIDGASNNKVEEVRDLRQNVGFRPTRSRYKVYIIDEVHMLSTSAFNALLKTLEEPPPHVKFIFATTEVQKIPITILSRCQRFDFAHVGPGKIFEQLKAIAAREGHEADDDALRLVARRAAGSMRDSQSLLDQLLASNPGRLTAAHVHTVLGTTGDERVGELAAAIVGRDPAAALNLIGGWADRGLQVGELVDQMIDYWRSLMLVSCAPDVRDLPVTPTQRETIGQQVRSLSLDTILAGLDVWTATKARMRGSPHTQVLLEMAVVRLARLDELLSVGQLAQALTQPGVAPPVGGGSAAAGPPAVRASQPPPRLADSLDGVKKNGPTRPEGPHTGNGVKAAESSATLTAAAISDLWGRLLRYLPEKAPSLAHHLKFAELPANFGPNSLAIRFHSSYSQHCEACSTELNQARLQEALQKLTGRPIAIKFEVHAGPPPAGPKPAAAAAPSAADRKKQLMTLPLFKKAGEVLGAQVWHADPDFDPAAAAPAGPAAAGDADPDDADGPAADLAPDPDEG